MEFDWDPVKAETNLIDHGVPFSLAQEVWDDPFCVISYDRFESGEHRYHAVGLAGQYLLLVVHAYPDDDDDLTVRLISARKATRHERLQYEKGDVS